MSADTNYWDNLTKPWDENDCENRYVYGRKIALVALSDLSGVPLRTIANWSTVNTWVDKRRDSQNEIASEVRQQIVSKQSTRISEILTALEQEHAEAFRVVRETALLYIRKFKISVDSAVDHTEITAPALEKFHRAVQSLKIGIDGERQANHLNLTNINVAFRLIESAGLKVVNPNDESPVEVDSFSEEV